MNPRTFCVALAVAAVAVLWACAAPASATVAVTSEDEIYTGEIVASSSNSELDGAFVTVKCGSSQVKGAIETHGESIPASGAVSSLTFSSCNYTVTVTSTGTLAATATSEGNGTLVSTGAAVSVATSVGTCVFTTNNTSVGTLTGSTTTNATWDLNSSKIPRTGGNFLCGSSGTWTGSYTVTTPEALALAPAPETFHFVAGKANITLVGSSEAPEPKLKFAFGEITCKKLKSSRAAVAEAKNRLQGLSVEPNLEECSKGGEKPVVAANECFFSLASGTLEGATAVGVAGVFCEENKSVEVKATECTIKIPKQPGAGVEPLKKVTYKNIGAGANSEVTAEVALTGIEYSEDGKKCPNDGKVLKNGEFTANVLIKAEAGGAQVALFVKQTG